MRRRYRSDQGFSLVELMVALLVGLIIMLGATQLFITGKLSYNRVELLAERQEALRFLTDVISLDIRTAAEMSVGVDAGGVAYLQLGYANRLADPYCNEVEELTALRYQHVNGSDVGIKALCGTQADWQAVALQPLVGGVARFSAQVGPDGRFVDIIIGFDKVVAEETANEFSLRVANRKAVTSRVRYR